MIQITIFEDFDKSIRRVTCKGHAGYAESGNDIICAAVSVLVINTINCIEAFTDTTFTLETEEKSGLIDFSFNEIPDHDCNLLLEAMIMGLQGILNDYGNEYLILDFKEV